MASFVDVAKEKHVVILSRTCLCLESPEESEALAEQLRSLPSSEFELYCTSHEPISFPLDKERSLQFVQRGPKLRELIKQKWKDGEVVIIVGVVDEDLHVAASTKSFLIGAWWVTCEKKVIHYGIPAPTPTVMMAILNIIVNQSGWYYKCTFDDPVPTKVVTLCKANTYGRSVEPDEKDMAKMFQAILKDKANIPMIKKALVCHLMAGIDSQMASQRTKNKKVAHETQSGTKKAIAHDSDFREVQDWAIAPSSSTQPNEVMEELKEDVRFMLNGRKPAPIFERHTATTKSRCDHRNDRQHFSYCQKHFHTIVVSEKYRGKLKNRVVCVMDDYLTNGSTFEALRNLLVACEVKKIIFVAIGKFLASDEVVYRKKSFTIEGDVHVPGEYIATFENQNDFQFDVDDDAQRNLGDLKNLARRLLQ